MATARPLTGVIFVLVCGSVIQSSQIFRPLPALAPELTPVKDSFASQRGPRVAASASVSSRKCNVIRRMTSYERTNVPFLCAPSGQMVPLPAQMDPEKAQVLNAMRSGGWSMCYKSVPMPVQKFQRIPVCCPGTVPTRNGGCIYPQPVAGIPSEPLNPELQGSGLNPPIIKQTPRALRKLLQGRRPNKMLPSHLMQQIITSRGMPAPPPGMMAPPLYASMPGPLGVASPEWQDEMARYVISVMYHQLLAERRQQLLQEEIERQLRVMMMAQQRRVAYQKLRQMILNHTPSNRDSSAASNDPAVAIPSLRLDATTLAPEVGRTSVDSVNVDNAPQMAVLQQDTTPTPNGRDTLLMGSSSEQSSQWNGSGPGILDANPDLRVPQETTPAGPLFVDGNSSFQRTSGTSSDLLQNTSGPSGPAGGVQAENEGIPVVNGFPGNVGGSPSGVPGSLGGLPGNMGGTPGAMGGMSGGMGGMSGGMGGMPGGMGGMPGGMGGMPGGMGGMPGGTHHGGAPQLAPGVTQEMLVQTRDKVKAMVEACLKQSSISNSMETIVQSGDVALLRPVCLASDSVGPCVMSKAKESFAEDNNVNMIGRQMVQGAMMSLGGLCMQLQKSGQLDGTASGNGAPNVASAVTTPPVFPNPAPSMSSTGVTDSVEKKFAPTQGSALGATSSAKSSNPSQHESAAKAAVDDAATKRHHEAAPKAHLNVHGHPHSQGQGHASASAHTQEAQEGLPAAASAASFPMWMILVMVGAAAALLLITCLVVCLVVRCRRRKKKVELEREPEKLPIPAAVPNVYAATPCLPPPAYSTTPVKQTLGGEEDLEKDFKIPEDTVEEKKEGMN